MLNLTEMKMNEILQMPTVVDNVHESIFRSYHILGYVVKLINRQDSKETILEIVDFLNGWPGEEVKINQKGEVINVKNK
jgi:hypothetical protein